MNYATDVPLTTDSDEIMRMVREETLLRPARRAGAFAALVLAASAFGWIADSTTADTRAIENMGAASAVVRSAAEAEPVSLLEADGDPHRLTIH